MAKKKVSLEEKANLKENVEQKEPVKKTKKSGNPVEVLFIMDFELVVMDSQKRGFRIPISKEHKDVKIGDIIYL